MFPRKCTNHTCKQYATYAIFQTAFLIVFWTANFYNNSDYSKESLRRDQGDDDKRNDYEEPQHVHIITEYDYQVNETSNYVAPSKATKDQDEILPFPQFNANAHIDKNFNFYMNSGLWSLWNGDKSCEHLTGHLLKRGSQSHPGALVSFPGSGNTWLRFLLMGVTGIFVVSEYDNDYVRSDSQAIGRYNISTDCGCALLHKTHDFALDGIFSGMPRENRTLMLNTYDGKGILLLRNPFRAIIAYRNFQSGNMTGAAQISDFEGKDWDEFVVRSILAWETLATVWIRGLKRGGVVYFERFWHQVRDELKRIVTMMGLQLDQERYQCTVNHYMDNPFKRKRETDNWDPYTASQKLLIMKSIETVQQALKERNLDPLPVHYYEHFYTKDYYSIIPKDF